MPHPCGALLMKAELKIMTGKFPEALKCFLELQGLDACDAHRIFELIEEHQLYWYVSVVNVFVNESSRSCFLLGYL